MKARGNGPVRRGGPAVMVAVSLAVSLSGAGLGVAYSRPGLAPARGGAAGAGAKTKALVTVPVLAPQLGALLSGATRLGPVGDQTVLHLSLGLELRDRAGLEALLDQGRTVPKAEYDDRFGPDPALVGRTEHWLRAMGLSASWAPGDSSLDADGPARAAEKAFSVSLSLYRSQGPGTSTRTEFYAPDGPPRLPVGFGTVVTSVLGLDDYAGGPDPRLSTGASCQGPSGPDGLGAFTPDEVAGFYNFGPLYSAGLSGAGQTVVFMEIDGFQASDLQAFASGFGLPPFEVTGPILNQAWGASSPLPVQGCLSETELDLEVVHAMAPEAQLVVYETGAAVDNTSDALQTAIKAYPHALFNLSLGACEGPASAEQYDALYTQLVASGGTAFVSSGDSGAYSVSCPGHRLTVQQSADSPHATAVGGTTALIGAGSTYGEEATWGEPLEQWGSGGGLSAVFKRPAWQTGLGVSNQYSNGMRQMPDVSAIADSNTGWDVFEAGAWTIVGGTSAAAPLWAALGALTDQALVERHLSEIGFANPALYDFGGNPPHFPARAFHPITRGTNLYYAATSTGWNFGTGWGTPNASAVVDDFIAFERGTR
jgi:kumamolisin